MAFDRDIITIMYYTIGLIRGSIDDGWKLEGRHEKEAKVYIVLFSYI